jgi:biopolymer transport protein ExbD
MLVTKFLSPSIAVTLPDSVTSDMDETKHVTITITEPGGIFLDDSQISMDEITTRLNGLRNSGEVGQVRLRADKTVDWEFIIEALDSIREAGISDVAFETDKEEES